MLLAWFEFCAWPVRACVVHGCLLPCMHGLRALACLLACIDGMRGMRVLACLLACVLARVFYMRVLVSFHSCAAIFNNSPLVLFGSLPGCAALCLP